MLTSDSHEILFPFLFIFIFYISKRIYLMRVKDKLLLLYILVLEGLMNPYL